MKNGIPTQHYYELLEWKDNNMSEFIALFNNRRMCDLTPKELKELYSSKIAKFKEGDILEFDGMGHYHAKAGATAICKGYKKIDGTEYLMVEWIRDELSEEQEDGGYYEQNFKLKA